ncbi:MAG: isochorismatase family protein [Geminicoccaceae bacterium]
MSLLVDRDDSLLLVVDVQERLASAIHAGERMVERITFLLAAATRLDIPVVFTEHYRKGLGRTLDVLQVEGAPVFDKIRFDAMAEADGLADYIDSQPRKQIIVTGCETHVCVLQTVCGLMRAEHDVRIVQDATGSRRLEDRNVALARMRSAGVGIMTAEMAVFEWLREGDSDAFRDLLPSIRALD